MSTGSNGFDGEVPAVLQENITNDFLPAGHSLWEVSIQDNPAAKMRKDFAKREGALSSTLVMVTTRLMDSDNRQDLETKLNCGDWKAVKIYDANSLETWLSYCPTTALWLSKKLQKAHPHSSIKSITQLWRDYYYSLQLVPNTELFLLAREDISLRLQHQVIDFIKGISKVTGVIQLSQTSRKEAQFFFAASLLSIQDEVYKNIVLPKVIVINRPEDYELFYRHDNKYVIFWILNVTGPISWHQFKVEELVPRNGAGQVRRQ